jgi:hypothetical protein
MRHVAFRERSLEEVKGTPRSALFSLRRSHRAFGPLLRSHHWPWMTHYLRVAFRRRHHFPTYKADGSGSLGVFPLPDDPCTVAVAADWGTGTRSAYRVAELIGHRNPEVTIHLGDIYYSGTPEEVNDFFLGPWPRGSKATYALNANHEMYSGGTGYFDHVLPALKQHASYFALQTLHWRILALDTGYSARTFPLLELLNPSIHLPSETLEWLADVVFKDATDRRPVVVLSHHQWFSAFDTEYAQIGRDLAPYLDKVLLWLWGHEHRFAAYAPASLDGLPRVRARCIGHGGMPTDIQRAPVRTTRPLVCVDDRKRTTVQGEPVGFCGFATLRFDGPSLTIAYVDEAGDILLEEAWTAGPPVSALSVWASPKLRFMEGMTEADLVK